MAKVKVELEVSANGYVTLYVDEDKIQDMLNDKGDDLDPDLLDELPCCIDEFENTFQGIQINKQELLNQLDFCIENIELRKPKL